LLNHFKDAQQSVMALGLLVLFSFVVVTGRVDAKEVVVPFSMILAYFFAKNGNNSSNVV